MKRLRHLLSRVPITVKVPVVVALLMAAVGIVASQQVLSRLVATQERQIRELSGAYLDGLASSLIEPVLRGDPWEIFDILDQARQLSAAVRPVETIVTDAAGLVLAGSDPRKTPIGTALPPEFATQLADQRPVQISEADSRAFVERSLIVEERRIGTLYAEFDISPLVAERRDIAFTLVSTNAALTLLFVVLGWTAVRRMVRPMKILSDHLRETEDGLVRAIPDRLLPPADSEEGRLFRRFNQMAVSVNENADLAARLAEEERLSSLGRLASGMAHEINNPLGGLFNAIDTLKIHGDKPVVRARSLSLIERGLLGIREVVQAALATYRARDGRPLTVRDLEDVRLLLVPELRRRRQVLAWHIEAGPLPNLPADLIRQVSLNLLLNASAASGENGHLRFAASCPDLETLELEISDSGPGMPADAMATLTGGGTRAILCDGKGLGLWMVRRLVQEIGGVVEVGHSSLGGTTIRLRLRCETKVRSDAA